MPSHLTGLIWHGFAALALENDGLRVTVVPESGARIVSLYDNVTRREWLIQPEESHPFVRLNYGADFNALTPGGWDEMFPTILAERYPAPGEFHGAALPDHGEVWAVPWSVEPAAGDVSGPAIRTSVAGRALPYRLTRSLSLAGSRRVALHYELTNNGRDPLYFLWAAHPQFASDSGTQVRLPHEVADVVNVLPLEWGEEWGPPGTRNAWPAKAGVRQDRVRSPSLRAGRKFFIAPDTSISHAGLFDETARCGLWLKWDAAALPYCGVWIDEGCMNARPSVAIEPMTGYHDTLTTAWNNGRLAVIQPGAVTTWDLAVELEVQE